MHMISDNPIALRLEGTVDYSGFKNGIEMYTLVFQKPQYLHLWLKLTIQ